MMKFNVPIYTAVAVIVAAMLFSCATVETPQMGPMETLRSSVILADGTPLPADGAYILLYYAADWCPYCLEYTEQLKSSYTALKSLYGRSFDLVFVGHVNDTENEQLLAFMEMGGYPFGYLPYEKREASGVMALMGEDRFYIPGPAHRPGRDGALLIQWGFDRRLCARSPDLCPAGVEDPGLCIVPEVAVRRSIDRHPMLVIIMKTITYAIVTRI